MKKLSILSALVFLLVVNSQAQEKIFQKFHFQTGAGASSNKGAFGKLSLYKELKKNWTIVLFSLPDVMPSIDINVVSLTEGKILPAGRKVWFPGEAGFSIVSSETKKIMMQAIYDGNGLFDCTFSNYTQWGISLCGFGCASNEIKNTTGLNQ